MRLRTICLLIPLLCTGAQAQPRSEFAALVERLSESGGYFDSDNLVSNETSYLHPLGALRREGVRGGAYLGVGPEQGFSYIAAIEPEIAFIVDVRRDNLLLHLLFKAMFTEAEDRLAFLGLLYGRPAPTDPARFRSASLEELLLYVDAVRSDPQAHAKAHTRLMEQVTRFGVPLNAEDRATIRRFHDEFAASGLDIRYRSSNRSSRRSYPTARDLYAATDLDNQLGSYLSTDARYQVVRQLQLQDRIVPVIGDLSGPKAVRAIGDYLRERGTTVSLFYLSNVEFYLFRSGTFGGFVDNVRSLPAGPRSMLVRSVFNRSFMAPNWVPGNLSIQLMQRWPVFLEYVRDPALTSYWGLTGEAEHVDLRGPGAAEGPGDRRPAASGPPGR